MDSGYQLDGMPADEEGMTAPRRLQPGSPYALTAIADLCEVLWQEREALEMLQFRLEEQQCLLASGETRWIRFSDADVRAAAELVKECEVLRAVKAQAVASDHGLSPDVTLRTLAEISPEPWSSLLSDHYRALTAIAEGSRQVVARTRRLIGQGFAHGMVRTAPGRGDVRDA